ncbi:MAG: thioesterase family protein [Bacteroidetes bacterium]|nr:MAG: thioesterase family protein [Bacteroidota bacterium]
MDKQQLISFFGHHFNHQIPFNKLLGMQVEKVEAEEVLITFNNKPELIGNTIHNILHGGVTSAVLDSAGGLVAMINAIERLEDLHLAQVQKQLKNLGTIDLRVDYLRPGRGEAFTVSAKVIRHGRKVAVTRMVMTNELGVEIAMGTGTYLVG